MNSTAPPDGARTHHLRNALMPPFPGLTRLLPEKYRCQPHPLPSSPLLHDWFRPLIFRFIADDAFHEFWWPVLITGSRLDGNRLFWILALTFFIDSTSEVTAISTLGVLKNIEFPSDYFIIRTKLIFFLKRTLIEFIHAVSCLIAHNYKIHECDHGKTIEAFSLLSRWQRIRIAKLEQLALILLLISANRIAPCKLCRCCREMAP